jgi:hypothetical protein
MYSMSYVGYYVKTHVPIEGAAPTAQYPEQEQDSSMLGTFLPSILKVIFSLEWLVSSMVLSASSYSLGGTDHPSIPRE